MHVNAQDLKGKVIAAIEDAPNRDARGDDPGFIMTFTDGSVFKVSAGMAQGVGYLIEEYEAVS